MDDGDGNLWIGTDNNGIYISLIDNNSIVTLKKEPGNPFSVSNNHINCFFKDDLNTMWVGTSKQGITYAALNNISFESVHFTNHQDICTILEEENGNMWLGLDGDGLAFYDASRDSYKYFKSNDGNIPSDLVICSFKDSKERIWFGTYGAGVFYHQNGKFHRLQYPHAKNKENPFLYVQSIVEDNLGNIWFGTIMHGLFCFDSKGEFSCYNTELSIMLTNSITDIKYSGARNLYVATSSWLYLVDIHTRKFTRMQTNKAGTQIFSDPHIQTLYYDSYGSLWIGSRSGIDIYNEKKDEITHLNTTHGLSHNHICAIIEDNNKGIWVTSDNGITNIINVNPVYNNNNQYVCYPYYEQDGIGALAFNKNAISCTSSGEILMGAIGGYLKITPKSAYNYNIRTDKVVFTALYIANKIIEAGAKTTDGRIPLTRNIQLSNSISMDYSDSNFALELSSMNYLEQHKVQYSYRLNSQEEWIKLESNKIHFNKLSPGTYNLEVKINETSGINNSEISHLTIIVKPPFWLSLPAYIIYALLISIIILIYIRSIRRRHKKNLTHQKASMEEAQHKEMTEAKMRFFTNVSHDLRTPLSLIITPIEKLLCSDLPENRINDLKLIHRNALTLRNEINQLLDFRKHDQNKSSLICSYGNLSEYVREICNSYDLLFVNSGISLNLNILHEEIDCSFDRGKMQRVLLNILSNAVKYNIPGGSITVCVDKTMNNGKANAVISVSDTGIGIKDENKHRIFDRFFQENNNATTHAGNGIGLHIVKEFVEMHNGSVSVTDNKPRGSVFKICLPIEKNIIENESALTSSENSEKDINKISVLIVEDNHDFRKFLCDCLKETYDVIEAADGKQALQVLSDNNVSIVISDVMMPVMDGLELCQKVKTDLRYSHIPVILLSARSAEEHIADGLREGADEYITKPFNLEILLLRIKKLINITNSHHEKFMKIDVSPADITFSTLDEKLIEKTIAIVEQNIDNSEFSVEELSALVGMSRSNLYKKLMSITGKSPLEFMRIIRLKKGMQLLQQRQYTISEIAYRVGLSPKQFSKYFRDEYGSLPSEYEKDMIV